MQSSTIFLNKSGAIQPRNVRSTKLVTTARAATQVKSASKAIRKAVSVPKGTPADALWLPNTKRPEWLNGDLPGDRGFDPLGLAAPKSYLQYDLDSLDLNKAVNPPGKLVGAIKAESGDATATSLQPYKDAFGLQRFRENELIHGRWAMLAALGVIVSEASTGVAWQDAGKVELDGAQYLGFGLPFSVSQLVWIEAILVGGAEIYRNTELDPERRLYPGGVFDPLGLASDPRRAASLKEAEIKHGRLAMVAFAGFAVQAGFQREGALGSLAKFGASFAPELTETIEKAVQ